MNRFYEGTKVFDNWISPERQAKAFRTYNELSKSQKGQMQILDDAKNGNHIAADYLFSQFTKVIAKAFWRYYLGPNKNYHSQRLASGAAEDFASEAYLMLLGQSTGGSSSPYNTFNPKKFSLQADLLKQFAYYLYRYLQSKAFQLLKADELGGLAGNVDSNAKVVSYDATYDGTNQDAAILDSYVTDIDTRVTLEKFLKKLYSEKPIWHDVMLGVIEGKNVDTISKELKVADQTIRNYIEIIKERWNSFAK